MDNLVKQTLPTSYHNFADKRKFMNIPNTLNVLSNLFILYPALYLFKKKKEDFLALVIFGLACSSAYYHCKPTHHTIFMDMIFVITLYTVILSYFIDENMGYLMIIIGIASVILWKLSGNILPYALLQVSIILFCSYKLYNTHAERYIIPIIGIGLAVRLVEIFDNSLYRITNKIISGHTLKHIFASLQIYIVILALEKIHKI